MIGTHNSLSYMPVYQWWLKPFFWVARCQSKDLLEQYNAGTRWFDFRCKRGVNGRYWAGHGLITYNVHVDAMLEVLSERCKYASDLVFVRLMLEDNSNKYEFITVIDRYKKAYPSLRFVDARIKTDFSIAVPGVSVNESHEYQLFQDYSATTFLQKIIGFKFPWPWYWAQKKQVTEEMKKDNIFHILDFV